MFSGGKDSIVMLRLAEKAFYPAKIPFPVLQVDTGFDFPEVLEHPRRLGRAGSALRLIVASRRRGDRRRRSSSTTARPSRNRLQIGTLLHAIEDEGFTAAFGGGRRDEEKARAKERVYSHRDEFGQWDPKNQRPGAVEPVQRPRRRGRAHADLPAVQLDRARHLALHRP
ncbi:MAG: phosphoadenosine phosphosulfate reductase family protein [Nocardioidaceae bacterium]